MKQGITVIEGPLNGHWQTDRHTGGANAILPAPVGFNSGLVGRGWRRLVHCHSDQWQPQQASQVNYGSELMAHRLQRSAFADWLTFSNPTRVS